MTDNYYNNKRLSNNVKKQIYIFSQEKNETKNNLLVNPSSDKIKGKAIDSFNIEEFKQVDEDIDHLQKFREENKNNYYHFLKNQNNSLKNELPQYGVYTNVLEDKNKMLQKKAQNIQSHKNIFLQRTLENKRSSSGEKKNKKQFINKLGSTSENKNNFIQRLGQNNKLLGQYSLFGNNAPKINYAPINMEKINNDNSENKFAYKEGNINIIEDFYSTTNPTPSPPETRQYGLINNSNNNVYARTDNPSDYNFNSLKFGKIEGEQNNFNKTNNIPPNKKKIPNQITSTFDLEALNNKIEYYPIKGVDNNIQNYNNIQNPKDISNVYNINNIDLGEQSLNEYETIGQVYNETNLTDFINPKINFNQAVQNVQMINKVPNYKNNIINNPIKRNYGGQIMGGKTQQINNNINLQNKRIPVNNMIPQNLNPNIIINNGLNNYQPINPVIKGNMVPPQIPTVLTQKQNKLFPPQTNYNFTTHNINNYIKNYPKAESERATVSNDKINEGMKKIPDKDIDISYSDFDNSGYVKNYGGVSRPGKNSAGKRKTNQDALVSLTNINKIKNFNIFGVLDGHGPDGHFVSKLASEFIPSLIINNPEIKSLKDPEQIYKKLKENNCKIITKAFQAADQRLKNVEFDALESGSTCCLVIHIGTHLICANTGDSRALVAFDETNDPNLTYLKFATLSKDFKPELPEEMSRILLSGGTVEQMPNELGVGPFRVWAIGEDYPGLAMSRSIGDLKSKNIGIIPDPGILEYDLNESSKFVVACSDGVWEFLSNQEVTNIGKIFYLQNDASALCHDLVAKSVVEWEKNDNTVDDITVVVAFF